MSKMQINDNQFIKQDKMQAILWFLSYNLLFV